MTIIDTSVMIPFLSGSSDAVDKVRGVSQPVVITVITAYELLKGAYLSSKPEDNLKDAKEVISNIHVLDLTWEACEEASKIFLELKQKGKMISELDILIAAIVKVNGEVILTRDKHFGTIKGLEIVNW